jgi:hypothetical protein
MEKEITFSSFLKDIKSNYLVVRRFFFVTTFLLFIYFFLLFSAKYSSSGSILSTGIDYDASGSFGNDPIALLGGVSGSEMNIFTSADIITELATSNQIVTKLITRQHLLSSGQTITLLDSFYPPEDRSKRKSYESYLNKGIKRFKSNHLSMSSGLRSNLINISVETFSAELSYMLLIELVNEIKSELSIIRNNNQENKLQYFTMRIEKVEEELSILRNKRVNFLQENRNTNTPFLQRELDELALDIRILENTYSVHVSEFELSKSKILSNKEVLQYVNQPIIPTTPSNSPVLPVLLFLVANFGFIVARVFMVEFFNQIKN